MHILLPQNFSVGGDHLQSYVAAEWGSLFFLLLLLLMPRLNGNSPGCVLGGCAEHAVVMIDKKEWGHRGRQYHSHHARRYNELLESNGIRLHMLLPPF